MNLNSNFHRMVSYLLSNSFFNFQPILLDKSLVVKLAVASEGNPLSILCSVSRMTFRKCLISESKSS